MVKLPSGQMVELSGCLALSALPDNRYQLFLKGFEQPIVLAESDGLQLRQLLEERSKPRGFVVRSQEEQWEINRAAMAKLQVMMDQRRQGEPSEEAEKFFEDFKEIVDAHRPAGQKLFSE
jgi:hypothetical protein